METKIKKRTRLTKEELILRAKPFSKRFDFQKYDNAAYKQAWRKGPEVLDEVCSHMDILWEPKWETFEEVQREAYNYTDRTSFARGSSGAYAKAQRMGWLDDICAFMGEKSNEAYSIEDLKAIALSCNSKEQLRNSYPGVYSALHRLGIIEESCAHITPLWVVKWDTVEKIHKEALKYSSRGEFKKYSSGAWGAARDMGVLDFVCSHMKRSRSISLKEKELSSGIKIFHSTAKTLRSKVEIEGKPHIKRFDIDIYIPELKLGIEFDGTYYHSYKKMKTSKAKKNWPDGDIRNYHEIKDGWFASLGIKIIHIKEVDWDLDKEGCIKRCLDFLGGSDVKEIA